MTVDDLIKNIPCDEKTRLAIQTIVQLAVELEREDCAKTVEQYSPTDADGVCPLAQAIRGRK